MTAALRLEGLSKRRRRRRAPGVPEVEDWALQDLSFAVPRGSAFGILDADPAGLATLLRVLTGLSPPTAGRALVRGWMAPPVLQAAASFDGGISVRENLRMLPQLVRAPRELGAGELAAALRFAGVPGTEDFELSRLPAVAPARMAFAGLLALEPDVLLCHRDPLPGDAAARERAGALIERARARGMAVVIATSAVKALAACDLAAWLDHGRVRQVGAAGEVAAAFDALHTGGALDTPAPVDEPAEEPAALRLVGVAVDSAGPRVETHIEATEPARVLVAIELRGAGGEVLVLRQPKASRIEPGRVAVRADLTGVALGERRYGVTADVRWALEDGVKARAVLAAEAPLEVAAGRAAAPGGSEPAWELADA
jgi:lipopolysaccharide transport system ATP-binding protein